MDKETKEKLDKLLNENKIDKKTYDEILSRFNKKEPDENNKNDAREGINIVKRIKNRINKIIWR